jgi:hypothetical protein
VDLKKIPGKKLARHRRQGRDNFHLQNEKYLIKSVYVYKEKNRNPAGGKPGAR